MEFYVLTLHYCLAAFLLLLLQCALVRHNRRNRRPMDGDGPFTLGTWKPRVRFVVATMDFIFLILPLIIFITAFLFALVVMGIEGWDLSESVEYLISNMIGIGPMVNLVPKTAGGSILDLIVCAWTAVLTTNALGLAASMSSIQMVNAAVPTTLGGFLRATFLFVPAGMFGVGALAGGFLALLEDWPFWDGFLFMTGQMCLIEDPLTAATPETDLGCFFWALCYMFEVIVGGAIIGILSAHPKMVNFTLWVEGELPAEGKDGGEDGAESKGEEEWKKEVASLKETVSKLSARLKAKGEDVSTL